MTRVSKVAISKDANSEAFDSFAGLVSDLKSKAEVKDFLRDFLTPEEKLMLSKRLVLGLMIVQEFSWSDIQSVLKVSRTTINLMRQKLRSSGGFQSELQKLVRKEKARDFERKLQGVLKHVPPLTRSKKDMAKWLNR